MGISKIEWCDSTINPFVGCSKCSVGCNYCYAERMACWLSKIQVTQEKYAGVVSKGKWTNKVNVDMSCFESLPKNPCRVFVNSMSDTFNEMIPYKDKIELFKKVKKYSHTFIFLTKRIEALYNFYTKVPYLFTDTMWLGLTVCTQKEVDEKLPLFLEIPHRNKFLSVEPMLEAIRLPMETNIHPVQLVICGAETGNHARYMKIDWAVNLKQQCIKQSLPFFFKKASKGQKIPKFLYNDFEPFTI